MGSDYQRIKVSEVTDGRVVLEVTEYHPDMAAIDWLLTGKRSDGGADEPLTPRPIPIAMASRARTFAAQLLTDYGDSDFKAAAVRRSNEDEDGHQADTFITDLVVRAVEPLARANGRGWLYRATLAIDLVDPSLARGFEVGDKYVARACPNGEWYLE
ncbi:hypothetical protein [Nannocystis punicea]|uniref:Uncharacterized protein n=1 Tax=Nannocystis punicea TaxID=2995304 RepID=A0ABY7HIC3_9BACT|nr:hypothetical protein [Nannocystis poenicansa]WAS98853.1 hypothetical protein O0S08_22205 [Nannocystis poenicansa]